MTVTKNMIKDYKKLYKKWVDGVISESNYSKELKRLIKKYDTYSILITTR
jgi:hypothetical protein